MRKCPNCGEDVPDVATKCFHCGSSVPTQNVWDKFLANAVSPSGEGLSRPAVSAIVSSAGALVAGASLLLPWSITGPFVVIARNGIRSLEDVWLAYAILLGACIGAAISTIMAVAEAASDQWLFAKIASIVAGTGCVLFALWARETSSGLCPCTGNGASVMAIGGIILLIGGGMMRRPSIDGAGPGEVSDPPPSPPAPPPTDSGPTV